MKWKFWNRKDKAFKPEEIMKDLQDSNVSVYLVEEPSNSPIENEIQGGENMTKETLMTTTIPREKGFLYCCGTSSDGKITIIKAPMARGRKKVKK